MNQKARVTKELNEKHRKILEGLLKLPENRECADCKSKGPRWASINLGIFICMQCSGIHRSLGVHISKVRSATLDTWLPDQIIFIQTMGNKKSNGFWEAELPPKHNRVGIENFIRAKYVDKRWISRDRKVESHLSIVQEENVPVYKASPTIVHLPERKQSPQLYKLNNPRGVLDQKVIVEQKQIEPESKAEESKVVENGSNWKVVDYHATDLFDQLPSNNSDTENRSKPYSNDKNSQARIQTSDSMLTVAEDNDTKKSSKKEQMKSEFENLFDGLDWVTQPVTQEPFKQVKNEIMNISEKQQQSKLTGNHQNGMHGFHPNPGFNTTSSMYGGSRVSLSMKPIGVSRTPTTSMRPLSIPTHLGGEYDFSSLTQGMFTNR